jgi:hypothetical protein
MNHRLLHQINEKLRNLSDEHAERLLDFLNVLEAADDNRAGQGSRAVKETPQETIKRVEMTSVFQYQLMLPRRHRR